MTPQPDGMEPISSAYRLLASKIGQEHASARLIAVLRDGHLASTAAAFTSYGRGGFAWREGEPVRFPSRAINFALPREFWLISFHRPDGEKIWADWEAGNFSWLDGMGSSAGEFGRSATGVMVSWPDALAAMAPHVAATDLPRDIRRTPGRPAGSRQFPSDGELAREGAAMLRTGMVASATEAARRLIHRADGASDDAKVRRLRPLISQAAEKN